MAKGASSALRQQARVPPKQPFAPGDRVQVSGAGKEWLGQISTRELPDGTHSIHPRHDDTAVYVTFDDTGVSMAVSIKQVAKVGRKK